MDLRSALCSTGFKPELSQKSEKQWLFTMIVIASLMMEPFYADIISSDSPMGGQNSPSCTKAQLDPPCLYLIEDTLLVITKSRKGSWRQTMPILGFDQGMWSGKFWISFFKLTLMVLTWYILYCIICTKRHFLSGYSLQEFSSSSLKLKHIVSEIKFHNSKK